MEKFSVEVRQVSKRFGASVALDKIDLAVTEGAFVVLLGPSGSGKTTLLSILGGFQEPSSGQVLIHGQDVTGMGPAKRPTATVFQDYALFPHMSVARNVGFGLAMHRVPQPERSRRVAQALEMVGLAEMGERRIHQLSGGQRQRVALARSLVVEPAVLLLDEPLGALDLNLRRQMQEELTAIQKRVGTTFIHVTHDQDEAMSIADMIVVLNEGRIEDIGSPQRIYLKPRSRFTATFMGGSNLIEGTVKAKNGTALEIETKLGVFTLDGDAERGMAVWLSLRPEQINYDGAQNRADGVDLGEVLLKEKIFLGTHYTGTAVHQASGQSFKVTLPQQSTYSVGDRVALSASRNDLVLLTR